MKILAAALLMSASIAAHAAADPIVSGRDYHSFAEPSAFRVKHLDLDLQASFEEKRLSGVADLTVARLDSNATRLVLDTRDLTNRRIWWMRGATDLVPLPFTLGVRDPMLGAPLTIDLPAEASAPELKIRTIRNDYQPAYPRLESYLINIGRRKLIKPLYEELMKTPAGAARARAIYAQARPNYHSIAVATLDGIVLARSR